MDTIGIIHSMLYILLHAGTAGACLYFCFWLMRHGEFKRIYKAIYFLIFMLIAFSEILLFALGISILNHSMLHINSIAAMIILVLFCSTALLNTVAFCALTPIYYYQKNKLIITNQARLIKNTKKAIAITMAFCIFIIPAIHYLFKLL